MERMSVKRDRAVEKISTNFKSEKVAFSKNIKHTYMAELFTMLI